MVDSSIAKGQRLQLKTEFINSVMLDCQSCALFQKNRRQKVKENAYGF